MGSEQRRIAEAATCPAGDGRGHRRARGAHLGRRSRGSLDRRRGARSIVTPVGHGWRGSPRGRTSTVLVADTSAAGGPGLVGLHLREVAPYGVADIGMLVIAGWRGLGLGARLLRRRHGVGACGGGPQDGPRGVAPQRGRARALPPAPDSSRRGARSGTIGAETESSGTPSSWGALCPERPRHVCVGSARPGC